LLVCCRSQDSESDTSSLQVEHGKILDSLSVSLSLLVSFRSSPARLFFTVCELSLMCSSVYFRFVAFYFLNNSLSQIEFENVTYYTCQTVDHYSHTVIEVLCYVRFPRIYCMLLLYVISVIFCYFAVILFNPPQQGSGLVRSRQSDWVVGGQFITYNQQCFSSNNISGTATYLELNICISVV